MKIRSSIALTSLAIGLPLLTAACSSSGRENSGSQGSLTLSMGATRAPAAGVQPATTDEDALSHLTAATMTIASVEARSTEGTWVVVDTGLPVTVDLLAILNAGHSVTLPADLIPEGQYNAIQIVITKVELTLTDGTQIAITPPGTGWTVQLPVDFSVVAGQATVVNLNFRCDSSFKLIGGEFEFDPEIEVEGVEHDGAMHP